MTPILMIWTGLLALVFLGASAPEAKACLTFRNQAHGVAELVNNCGTFVVVLYNDQGSCRSRGGQQFPCEIPHGIKPGQIGSINATGSVRWNYCKATPGRFDTTIRETSYGRVECGIIGGQGASGGPMLSANQLASQIGGQRFWVQPNNGGPVYQARFVPGGEFLIGVNGRVDGIGRWWVQGNTLCTQLNTRNGTICHRFTALGGGKFRSDNGTVIWYR